MIHSQPNKIFNYILKMSSSEFLLINKNKNHNNSHKSYKNTNLVTIGNGVSF